MQKLDYHEFYEFILEGNNLIEIVSDKFFNKEQDFLRALAYDLWRYYDLGGGDSKSAKKIVEIFFTNMAMHSPNTKIIRIEEGPVSDRGRNEF